MKNTKNYFKVSLVSMFVLIIFSITANCATTYSPVVSSLKKMYETDAEFRSLMDNTLKSAIPPLEGWSADPENPANLYVWSDKTFEDFLDFFEGWLTFVPNPNNGMMYYELLYGLCYENPSAIKFVSTEPGLSWTKKFVMARGKYMDDKASIDKHMQTMKLWKEAMIEDWNNYLAPHDTKQGFEGYTTFNEFFTRNIKDGVRPISDPNNANTLVAPADGLVNVINENLNTNSRIHTKYNEYLNVDQLLAGSEYADKFIGGTATSTVLLPDNYHHFHSPASGQIVESKNVDSDGGVYFGMDGQFFTYLNNGNVGGYLSKYGVFGVYHRGYYIIKTKDFGCIALVAIGLDDISSIKFEPEYDPKIIAQKNASVMKGQKVGHFAYGGSTVILLFEPGVLSGIKLKQGAQLSILSAKQIKIKKD